MRKIVLFMCFLYILNNNCPANECFLDSMQNEILKDFKGILNNHNSYINSINFIIPDCKSIDSNSIVGQGEIYISPNVLPWNNYYLRGYPNDNIKYMLNQKNGDDWIVGWFYFDGAYIQFIDGRTFTILIKFNDNDTININSNIIFKTIYKRLNRIVNCKNLFTNGCSGINIISKNERFIEGYFSNLYLNFSELKKDYIWTNGRYVILDIVKLNKPVRLIKDANAIYFDYTKIIDGIPKSDKRSFTRFRQNNNIDLHKEMFKIFPWMIDSIQYFKTHINSEVYGRTPDYKYKSKEEERKEFLELRNKLEKDTCE